MTLVLERTVADLTEVVEEDGAGERVPGLSLVESGSQIKTIRALLNSADIPVSEIAARFHIARSTLYRAILKPAA